ncbi:hypothetical protein WMY93_025771 [Mugilogobius chulae]|uniref:Piccolo presynaptic cytomatrix protein a n=1 Tax=Mugilogobius chulae TaxID=88201 RepID=A0AAW0N1B4_9GOBI
MVLNFLVPQRSSNLHCGALAYCAKCIITALHHQTAGRGLQGPAGLSKSRTVDAFNQGPVGKPSPGRSPSSLSLFESRFRQEPKSSDSKSSGMFGSSFLSGANPLSAMTSSVSSSLSSMGDAVAIPKFGIFGDEEESDAPVKGPQQQGPKGPQQGGPQKPGQGPPGQGPKQGQGPPGQGPKQGQGPPGQGPKQGQGPPGQGPKQGQGPPGQGPKPGQGPPGQQGPKQQSGPPGPGAKAGGPPQQKAAGSSGAGSHPGPAKTAGPATQQGPGKPVPCPLCKTTQMNIGSKEPPNYNNCTECKSQVCSLCGFSPPDSAGKEWLCLNCQMQRAMGGMDPPNPKQGSAPPSPQKQSPGKPGNLLIKQQSHQSDQGLTPPTTPRQKSPGATSSGPPSPGLSTSGSPKIDPKTGKPIMQKSSPQQSPSKAKQESSFFGGFGLGGLTDSVKSSSTSSQSDSVTGKLFGGFGGLMETSKPQAQTTSKQEESVAGKLFSGFGGLSDSSSKPPAAASQMFSFGSSLLNSATNLVSGDDSKPAELSGSPPQSPADSGPGSPPDSPFSGPGSPPDTDSAPDTPPAKFTKPFSAAPKQSCPLCNVELNVGSSDTPNYNLCTECKKTVCNLCGFNPTPHLGEKEWLCLTCQTQRAMSDSKPVVEPADQTPAAPDEKVEEPITLIPDNASITSSPLEIPPVIQEQSIDREEGGPKPETDASNTEPCVPVSEVAVAQEDKNTLIQYPSEESEKVNVSTKTEIDNTMALSETQPKPEISQSEAPADKQEEVSPIPDMFLDETANSGETKTPEDHVVSPNYCKHAADVLKGQNDHKVENTQSLPADQAQSQVNCDDVVNTEIGCEPKIEISTEIKSAVNLDTENPKILGQAVTEVKDDITDPESFSITENITKTNTEVDQCVENKGTESTIEQLPASEISTQEIVTGEKPEESNIVDVTPGKNNGVEEEIVQMEAIKQSAIESPVVVNESHDGKAFEQEETVTEGSTEVKANESVEKKQDQLEGSVCIEEACTNVSLTKSGDNCVLMKEDVSQANTHVEEKLLTSELSVSSYLEQDTTNTKEPLPSEDNVQESAVDSGALRSEILEEEPGHSKANCAAETQHKVNSDLLALTGTDEKQAKQVTEQKVSVIEKERDFGSSIVESQPVAENLQISISDTDTAGEKDATATCKIEHSTISQAEQNSSVSQIDSTPSPAKPEIPNPVVSTSLNRINQEEKKEESSVKPSEEDTTKVKITKEAPTQKEPVTTEGSSTSQSELTKLESNVLPIHEIQPKQEEQTSIDTPKTRRKLEVLPIMPDSPSSEEEREIIEQNVKVTEKKKLLVPMDIRGDSLEDSSESIGKESPISGDDEDFIRKQIIEMSENEDASPTDEENLIRQKIKEQEKKSESEKTTISPDDEEEKIIKEADSKPAEESKESKQEESVTAVCKFQTMELNTPSMIIATSEGEVEMECLTDSPDDRSKGEGSSSLHASSFTPGTSPTSMSSFDEDSDSSSPSNISTSEGKQQRKAKHRQPGQLPTIEDSSEEEELREEEELLREQEKQKGSGKKSKKDKEDKSRRRERSKTPPSNLSPIEDASPTEELRQEAEMEEIRRSSCSDFSPSLDSDPEGFEIHASKIAAVQKSYKLPVSAHSPSEDKTQKQPLKSADEAYEEILLRAKSPTTEKVDNQPEKEALYGGMLIEDYAYTSLIDSSTNDIEEPEKMTVPTQPKKLRSPDEVYEDMLKKRKEFQKLEEEYQKMQPKQMQSTSTPEIVLQPAENINKHTTVTIGTDGKPLLDADTAYEELMKKVTSGTSPTQPDKETTTPKRALHPIPDLKVTQCSSGELSSDDETFYKKEEEPETQEPPPVTEPSPVCPSSDITATTCQAAVDLSALSKNIPMMGSVEPLPTVPQYTPGVQSVVSTAPPVPPNHIADMPVAPPPTPPKPTVFPRKAPVPLPPQASTSPVKPDSPPTVTPTYKAHVPPPVPPKPCLPSGVSEAPRAAVKPPIAPKPGSQPTSPAHVPQPPRPTMLPTSPAEIALNLSPTSEQKQFQPSPKSPPSPRYASNLRDTYVVITLPSQPSSPVETISTQAPSSPSPVSPSRQAQPQSYAPSQAQQTYPSQQVPSQQPRVPLAYTRVTESIESQEICSPEKHVSSSCHIIEAISASAQPPVVTPNLISQVVTTEVQRTTVSVVHERPPPPVPAPRANGVPLDKSKPQIPPQTTQAVQPCEVVDLRTMKVDQQSNMNGVDLSAGPDSRRQSYVTDASRQNSAVQSPVVNLSAESSTVSIVTDSITIVTCAATIQRWDNADTTTTSSPVSQIIYRPVDSQPPIQAGTEIPINLSVGSGAGTYQSAPVTTTPPCASSSAANGLTTGTATVAGAVDLSTTKPFNTVVSVEGASSEVVTAVITDDDGKPVDLTAGKRAVCCDVVYNLPFAGSCTRQQPTTPLPEDRFGYRDDHYQYDRTPYGMRGFGGIKPSMSDTNLAEAGLFFIRVRIVTTSMAPQMVQNVCWHDNTPYSDARATSAVGTALGTTNVLRSSNGIVYSSVGSPNPSTYAITTQPGSIFSTTYNNQSGMHTSDTMPSLSNLQNMPLTRSHSFLSTLSAKDTEAPLNLELSRPTTTGVDSITTPSLSLDTYTDASLEAIAASLEALSSPMVAGDGQYQAERERLEMEKLKQQRLAEELEKERQEIQRFREHEQFLVQKELEERRKTGSSTNAKRDICQQQQLEQIQRLQEQLRLQLEEQKLRQLYPGDITGHGVQEAVVLGPDGTVLARKITDSGCQTDEEDETISNAYTAGRRKKNAKKSVDSCVQTDDEDQEEWEENRNRRPRTARGDRTAQSEVSLQAHTEISIQTDTEGNIRMESRVELSDSERTSPKKRPTPLEIGQPVNLKIDSCTLQAPKSPKVLYSPLSPCISPSKSLEFVSYEKSLGSTSPQKLSPRGKAMQRSLSDPKPMSPTAEERAASGTQYADSYSQGKASTPTGTQKKVKRTLPNPPSEEESTTTTATTTTGQTAYSTNSARRRMCRNSNMARAKILQDIDRELDMVERESSKLRKRQAELDEEEKEIDAKLRYLEMGINRRKDALLKERDKRERAYLQNVADERDYMSDSEVSHIRETRSVIGAVEDEEIEVHGLERPRTAPQSELDDFGNPQTKGEYDKYSQYPYSQSQYQSLYQTPQSYQSPSIYSSVPSLTTSQQQSYQMLLLQQKAARQAALLSELDATKYDVISRQPDPTSSAFLGVKYDKYGNHLDLRALDVGSIPSTPMSAVSDSYYPDVDHHTPRSYMLLEDAAEIAKGSAGLSSSYSLAERELAKAEKLLRRSAADLGSTDYLGSTSRLHTYGKTPDEEDTMEEPYELKLLKQQLKQEFRRSTSGSENLEQLSGLSQHYYTPTTGLSSYSQRQYPKTDKYSISRLTLEKQAAKQLPASMLYQKHKTPLIDPKISSKYPSVGDRGLESEYTSYIGSSGSPRTSRLMQDEITFGLRKNIAEQQKYLGSNLGTNLAGSLNLGQSLGLDSAYPSGSRSRPPSRPTSCYGLDLSIKRDPSSSSLRLKGDGESGDGSSYQTPSGRTKPTSLPIVQSGRGRIPIVAQNSEEESPLSPVGQPMGMARASAGPLPPISADSRDQFGSCLSLQDPQQQQQQQYVREEPTRGRGSVLLDDLQGTMSDSEAYHLRREETDWFEKPRDGRPDGLEKRQGKGPYYSFPHLRVKLQRDPKDRTVSGNGLGIRVVGGKEVPNSNGDIGAYVAKVLPGGAAEQTGKILEGMQVLEWNGVFLTGKTYEEVQGLVGQPCNEADVCVRLDLNMLAESETSQNLDFQEHSKSERPPRSPGVDPKQLAAELQKVSQQQAPSALPPTTSAISSPAQPGSPSVGKKRHSSKSAEGAKSHSHPISGEIQLQIHYDKQLGNLIVHVLQARNLAPRDNNGYSDPFVKVYLLPGRGQVMVVQNASAENKRRSKHAGKSINPEWNQTVIYKNIHLEQLKKKTLEVSVWDYDKCSSNDFLGEVLIDLSNTSQLDNVPRWLSLKEQSEGDHHRRSHSGRHSSKTSSQHSSPKTGSTHDIHDSPKSSVTKSRSHGVFPDPAKDTQAPSIEKSHSSPGTAKPSHSEGQSHGHGQHSRSHGAHTKSTTRHHQDSGRGSGIATGDAPEQSQQQPPQCLQPSKPRRK